MAWAALILWVLTAGGGFVLLARWLQSGGMKQIGERRIRPPLILGHFGLAATGLVLWIVYVATDSDALAWIALVLLLIVAALGLTMFGLWLSQRKRADHEPAEQKFPVAIVGLHGVLAATTLVLVLLAAAGVGES